MKLLPIGKTNVGMKRKHNEDNFILVPEEDVYVVADGMGGHKAGEVASEIAVQTSREFFLESTKDPEMTWIMRENSEYSYNENRMIAAIKLANLRIFEAASNDIKKKGMGTTVVGIMFDEENLITGHAGDSRAYLIRDGKLTQVTEDHSLLNNYIKIAKLTQEEIDNFPHKNVIVRALGMKAEVDVEINRLKYKKDDIFLVCSDGLSGEVTDPRMLEIVLEHSDDLEKAADVLIQDACDNGGKDNITLILVKVLET